ncbi:MULTISPECIES: GNAT family N-acetyltransferase [Desulfovibrio]|uniref:GNAT family N-acetyltransferase n=1 Tax=Desulfovibrio TaxID=872 RepID=UPI00093054F4|nr:MULTISPECIES: GNAT family N-acetyltransferase [Desulfovibrio]ATD82067.1 GNAT family N-acetyltransferase [Desulfovibrio sp. G11]
MNITSARPKDIPACADIWLSASIEAHSFISPDFWTTNYPAMLEQYLPASEVFIATEAETIAGFAALYQGTLVALFVLPAWWSKGVGSLLLKHAQTQHSELTLTVYTQNSRAIGFYQRHGFTVQQKQVCSHTNESELLMLWKKQY